MRPRAGARAGIPPVEWRAVHQWRERAGTVRPRRHGCVHCRPADRRARRWHGLPDLAEVYAQRRDLGNAFSGSTAHGPTRDPGVLAYLHDPYLLRLRTTRASPRSRADRAAGHDRRQGVAVKSGHVRHLPANRPRRPHPETLDVPRVMGIVNATPDSFADGGEHATVEAAIAQG